MPERSNRSLESEGGVVARNFMFLLSDHPVCADAVASRHLINGATTPPLEGVLLNCDFMCKPSRVIPNIEVVLVPDRLRNRSDLFKGATSDAAGRFTITGITPGDYKLFAWEQIEPYGYFDPDLLKAFEASGKPVRVSESSRLTVDVVAIPPRSEGR